MVYRSVIMIIALCFVGVSDMAVAAKGGKGGGSTTSAAQCSDGKDNDGDNLCDYGGCTVGKGNRKTTLRPDPDCSSAADNSEASTTTTSPYFEAVEKTCDGRDNDGDGQVDEGCSCTDGQQQQCSTDVGACKQGTQTCVGGAWGDCKC